MRLAYLSILLLFSSIVNSQSIGHFYDHFCIEDSLLYEGQVLEVPEVFIRIEDPTIMKDYYFSFNPILTFLEVYPNARIEIRIHNAWNSIFEGTPYKDKEFFIPQVIADSVRLYLIEKGISPDRIEANSYSLEFPVIANKQIADNCEYIEEGDTLDQTLLEEILLQIDQEYKNKNGQRRRKRKYEQEHIYFRSLIYAANKREEVVIIEL